MSHVKSFVPPVPVVQGTEHEPEISEARVSNSLDSTIRANELDPSLRDLWQPDDNNPLDDIVEQFRTKSITKPQAIIQGTILLKLEGSEENSPKVTAFSAFCSELDAIEEASNRTTRRGEVISDVLTGTHSGNPQNLSGVERDSQTLKSNHSRKRPDDSDSGDSLEDEEPSRGRSNRKRRLYESDMPWYRKESEHRVKLQTSECTKSRDIIELLSRDLKASKRWARTSITAPNGFPSSEWDAIFKGEAVDLNNVLSTLHIIRPLRENIGRLGDTEIGITRIEPIRKVKTASDWISAWNATVQATKFVFPHREEELRNYGDYIQAEFSAKRPEAHPRVILFDESVRGLVGGGQNLLLTDKLAFSTLYSAIMLPDGVESGPTRDRASARLAFTKTELCNRFNSPNGCRDDPCRYKHACKRCKQSGHGRFQCTIAEGRSSTSAASKVSTA